MKISDDALEEMKRVVSNDEIKFSGIRFFTIQGCCSPGLQMEAVEKPGPDDKEIKFENLSVFIEPQAESLLTEVTIELGPNGFWLDGMKRVGCC